MNIKKNVIDIVAGQLLPEVISWCNDNSMSKEEVKKELVDTISLCTSKDGYDLAVFLERQHDYTPDAELVKILSKTRSLYYKNLYNEAKNSIGINDNKNNNTLDSFQIGDRVIVFDNNTKKDVRGVITKIFNFGKAEVYCPELGHVNPFDENDNGNNEGVWGILISCHKLRLV